MARKPTTKGDIVSNIFDASALTASIAPVEMEATKRGRTAGPNPFLEYVQNSYNSKQALGITVDSGAKASQVRTLLNQAAKALNLGVAIQFYSTDGEKLDAKTVAKYDGAVSVRWLGKVRKASSATVNAE